jgi:D-sorbitol dehydrogenase (acceptor)
MNSQNFAMFIPVLLLHFRSNGKNGSKFNVNGISPGVVDTPMWNEVDALFAKYENRPLGEKKRLVGEAVPYGRMGLPADHAGAAVFLASGDSDYMVAQTLNVDGGNWMS